MACNCNTASKTCDLCAFCTPPGVTGLTTCQPVDPCDEKVGAKCFFYNGPDASCIGINQGDDLASVLLALLQAYFLPGYCCGGYGTATWSNCFLTGSANWVTPSTTTSTSTTTTASPACSFYEISNAAPQSSIAVIQYIPCNCLTTTVISLTNKKVTICINAAYPINTVSGTINTPINLGPCTSPPCPTTTTTTIVPTCACTYYTITNNNSQSVSITYTACTPSGNQRVNTIFGAGTTTQVCACSDIRQTITGVVIINSETLCFGPPTTTTTTIDCTNTGGTVALLESFKLDANLVTNIAFNIITSSVAFKVDWGDGSIINYPAGYNLHTISHTYTGSYSGPVTFYSTNLTGITQFYDADYSGSPTASLWPAFNCLTGGSLSIQTSELNKLDGCTNIEILNTKTIGNINNLPKSLLRVVLWGNGRPSSANCANTLSGNISNMPPLATSISILGNNTLTGNISTLPTPSGITNGYSLAIGGQNTVWGDIQYLPTGASTGFYNNIELYGNNTVTGYVGNIPNDYLKIHIYGGVDNGHTDGYGNTIWGNLNNINSNIIEFDLRGDNTITGDLDGGINSTALILFYLRGKSTIYGNINDIVAPNLKTLSLIDDLNITNVTGDLSNLDTLFPVLTTIQLIGPHTVTGFIGNIPNSLIAFLIESSNANLTGNFLDLITKTNLIVWSLNSTSSSVSGELTNLPSSLKIFVYSTTQALSVTFTPPHGWANPMQMFNVITGTAMSSASLNNLLVSLSGVPTWAIAPGVYFGGKTVKLKGVASGAGLTAITTLISKGVTVTITP